MEAQVVLNGVGAEEYDAFSRHHQDKAVDSLQGANMEIHHVKEKKIFFFWLLLKPCFRQIS